MFDTIVTPGVYNFCEEHRCYWFLDVIKSYQTASFRQRNEFQVWKLELNKTGNGAKVICEDGNENVVLTQRIPHTDYKGEVLIFWCENKTVYLPEEH